MLSVHLSYKPPSSWSILFCSGGRPRQFSCLKKFRSLVFPRGGCRKDIIIQGRHLKRWFSCVRPLITEKKRGCNRIVWPCTHYVQAVYLRDHTDRTPSLSNPPIWMTPPGTLFMDPLHTQNMELVIG